jgi:hypothetical protein
MMRDRTDILGCGIFLCGLLLFSCPLLLGGCAGARPASVSSDLPRLFTDMSRRITERGDSTHTASYRVRWRVREVEPHSDMILRIDYKAPGSYHIVGKGPMDVPVFTAWVADSQYVLLAHRENEIVRGHLRTLNPAEFTLDIRPIGGFLELFAGNSGIQLPDSADFNPAGGLDADLRKYLWVDDLGRHIEMDLDRSRLKEIIWERQEADNDWVLTVRYGRFNSMYPFWDLLSAHWDNRRGPGQYDWEVLAQKYNPDLPERLFLPPDD